MILDKIEIKNIKTNYNTDVCITLINGVSMDIILSKITENNVILDLYPAWGNGMVDKQESAVVWELLESKGKRINVPILVCPDDLDLSCIIVIAQIEWYEDTVVFNKVGILSRDKYSVLEELSSGILLVETWSDLEWEMYGGTLAWCKVGDLEWKNWINQNFEDEKNRRLHNYFLPYLQNDLNILWCNSEQPIFEFLRKEFEQCFSEYKSSLD